MKKLTLLSFAIASMCAFTSCQKDSENGTNANSIIGTWEVTKAEYMFNGQLVASGNSSYLGYVITLTDDGSFLAEKDGYTHTATYTFKDNMLYYYSNQLEIVSVSKTEAVVRTPIVHFDSAGDLIETFNGFSIYRADRYWYGYYNSKNEQILTYHSNDYYYDTTVYTVKRIK